MVRVHIEGHSYWTVRQHRKGHYLARCDKLGLSAIGDTLTELREMIAQTLHALVAEALEEGRLDPLLAQHGWVLGRVLPAHRERVRFDVPYELVRVD
jgi:predicted RNase H-like HicB family nuclease